MSEQTNIGGTCSVHGAWEGYLRCPVCPWPEDDGLLPAPGFTLAGYVALRNALKGALQYVAPVGLSEHATNAWRAGKNEADRLDALIDEYREWEAYIVAAHDSASVSPGGSR